MPTFKAAYLIHGDDHGRIAERRARLRGVAEAESGSAGVEVFENETGTPDHVAGAISAMTFAIGRRFIIADGVERWKDSEVAPVVAALKTVDADTLTVTFFAREDGRYKTPAALVKAVSAVGGVVQDESAVKGGALPRWVQARAKELGLELDHEAARALIHRTGERQQRLLRELEKLTLEHGPGAELTAQDLEAFGAPSAERQKWALGDAVVAGDRAAAVRALVELRGQGERVGSLLYAMTGRVQTACMVANALENGERISDVKGRLRMPFQAKDRLIEDVRRHDAATYRRALELLADLEHQTRGGGNAALGEETAALRVIYEVTT